ncbi:MAG: hypothetical protein IPI28_00020 [Candidatus Omnitrophica bacterium]|nr:hypothetical protein [Candidatus Omnitrophota bacterium]
MLHGYLIANARQDEMQILNVAVAPGISPCDRACALEAFHPMGLKQSGRQDLSRGAFLQPGGHRVVPILRFKPVYTRKKFYYDPVEEACMMLLNLEGENEVVEINRPDSQTVSEQEESGTDERVRTPRGMPTRT